MVCLYILSCNSYFMILNYARFVASIGKIGITGDISWPEPKTDSTDDKIASEMALQFYVSYHLNDSFHITTC